MVAGRRLPPTQVFDTYWRFAAARQQVYQARLRGDPGPWTADPILATYRFTNCYRAADRVSQYLIKEVIYRGSQHDECVHLLLAKHICAAGCSPDWRPAKSMAEAFDRLRGYSGIGDFLAYQLMIDINYSTMINFDEMDFVVPGPGAKDGLRKCFGPGVRGIEADLIRYMSDGLGRLVRVVTDAVHLRRH